MDTSRVRIRRRFASDLFFARLGLSDSIFIIYFCFQTGKSNKRWRKRNERAPLSCSTWVHHKPPRRRAPSQAPRMPTGRKLKLQADHHKVDNPHGKKEREKGGPWGTGGGPGVVCQRCRRSRQPRTNSEVETSDRDRDRDLAREGRSSSSDHPWEERVQESKGDGSCHLQSIDTKSASHFRAIGPSYWNLDGIPSPSTATFACQNGRSITVKFRLTPINISIY